MQPQLKVLTIMVNSQYNGWRMEDVWLDLRLCCCGGVATATRRSWNIGRSRPEPPPSPQRSNGGICPKGDLCLCPRIYRQQAGKQSFDRAARFLNSERWVN
jgi:hypothetical protein